jgi:hypothetical protein
VVLFVSSPIGMGTRSEDCDILVLGYKDCVKTQQSSVDSVQNYDKVNVWHWHNA